MGVICSSEQNADKKVSHANKLQVGMSKEEIEKGNNNNNNNNHNNKDKEKEKNTTSTQFTRNTTTTINTNVVALDSNVFISRGAKTPSDLYSKQKLLGSGSFGVVHLVKHKDWTKYYAMKIIAKNKKSKEDDENIKNEINILKKLDHPNILKITDFYSLKNEYNIITEYCQEGELFNEIKRNAPFNETWTGHYMKQILSAICYCHGMNVIHRDWKPENILIVKRVKNGFHPIKIIDFGTAKVFSKGSNENWVIGSAYYIAPEVLSRNYTEKCDLWSCGVIMYILLTGQPPFNGRDDKEVINKIKRGKFDLSRYPWGVVSNEAKDWIRALLNVNTEKRWSAEEALKHPWFSWEKLKAISSSDVWDSKKAKQFVKNLKNYRSDNILRSAVIAYLVHNNTQIDQAREAIKLFNKIDVNFDGRITKEELFSGLKGYLDWKDAELQTEVDVIFNNIDTDHNGSIEYEEFIRAAIDKDYFLKDHFLQSAFNYFDQDRSGQITIDEVTKLFYQNTNNKNDTKARDQLKQCFNEIDINGDGSLSFEEFCRMMKNIINSN